MTDEIFDIAKNSDEIRNSDSESYIKNSIKDEPSIIFNAEDSDSLEIPTDKRNSPTKEEILACWNYAVKTVPNKFICKICKSKGRYTHEIDVWNHLVVHDIHSPFTNRNFPYLNANNQIQNQKFLWTKFAQVITEAFFTCKLCSMRFYFISDETVYNHLRETHNVKKPRNYKPVKYTIKDLNDENCVWNHAQKINNRNYQCKYCHKTFIFFHSKNIWKHLKTRHNILNKNQAKKYASLEANLDQFTVIPEDIANQRIEPIATSDEDESGDIQDGNQLIDYLHQKFLIRPNFFDDNPKLTKVFLKVFPDLTTSEDYLTQRFENLKTS